MCVGDAAGQARRCLEVIAAALEKAGASMRDVVRTRALLTRIEVYIPTLCLPEQGAIQALQGIPAEEEDNLREISLNWVLNTADAREEFLVAFRDGPGNFRVIRRFEGGIRGALFPASTS